MSVNLPVPVWNLRVDLSQPASLRTWASVTGPTFANQFTSSNGPMLGCTLASWDKWWSLSICQVVEFLRFQQSYTVSTGKAAILRPLSISQLIDRSFICLKLNKKSKIYNSNPFVQILADVIGLVLWKSLTCYWCYLYLYVQMENKNNVAKYVSKVPYRSINSAGLMDHDHD